MSADLWSPAVAKWQYIEERARGVLDSHGFTEVRVAGGDLPRAYVAAARWTTEPVTRAYALGETLRVAAFGSAASGLDAELIAMAVEIATEAGVDRSDLDVVVGGAFDERLDDVRGQLAALGVDHGNSHDLGTPLCTATAFELRVAHDVLIHGCRADDLVTLTGGPATPAFVFDVDLAAVVDAVPEEADSFVVNPSLCLVGNDDPSRSWVLPLAQRLRRSGVRVELLHDGFVKTSARLLLSVSAADLEAGRLRLVDRERGGPAHEISERELLHKVQALLD